MTNGWLDEEDDEAWRSRRRAARSSPNSELHPQPVIVQTTVSSFRCSDNFGSNLTTSSISSVRTKNTFLEIQDDFERLSLERIRSGRSRSQPPVIPKETIEDMASFYLGQLADLDLHFPVEKPPPPAAPPAATKSKKKKTVAPQEERKTRLFVGGLPESVKDDDLRIHFSIYGDLVEAAVILDKRSRHSRGFGFVAFRDGAIPPQVLTDDHVIDGTVVGVRLYEQ